MYNLKEMDECELGEYLHDKLKENAPAKEEFILGEFNFKKVKISFE